MGDLELNSMQSMKTLRFNNDTWCPLWLCHVYSVHGSPVGFSLHLIFTFYLNRDTSVIELFPVVVFQLKKDSPVLTHLLAISKPSLKLWDCGRKIQNDVDIDTYYCKPELISWRVFCPQLITNVRSRWRIDSSSIITHPVNFDIQRERSLKCDAKHSTYVSLSIYNIYISLSTTDMDLLIAISIGNTKNHV